MAFARQQGKTIRVFYSSRNGKQVKQQQLHCFSSYGDAWKTVHSPVRWKSTAMAMLLRQGKAVTQLKEMDKVRDQIVGILEENRWPEQVENELVGAVTTLRAVLREMQEFPLSEPSVKALTRSSEDLRSLAGLIESALNLADRKGSQSQPDERLALDNLLDEGLEHYSCGDWRRALKYFQAGLMIDPDHVDLNVHAGLCCLQADQLNEALTFFDRAYDIGMKAFQFMRRQDPERFLLKSEFMKKWHDSSLDLFIGDTSELTSELQDEMEEDRSRIPNRSDLELRPLFRAAHNKVLTLQRLKRHQEAIELAEEVSGYWHTGFESLISYSYMCLANYEEAQSRGAENEPLHNAFIELKLANKKAFLKCALQAMVSDTLLVAILVGRVSPYPERVYGSGGYIDPLCDATNGFLDRPEYGDDSAFRNGLKFVTEHSATASLFNDLCEARMDGRGGAIRRDFADDDLVDAMLRDWGNVEDAHWLPDVGTELEVRVLDRKKTHWLVQISSREFYYRPSGLDTIATADFGIITVNKAWYHRKRLYVTGSFLVSK